MQDTFQKKANLEATLRLKPMVVRSLEQINSEQHVSFRERQLEKPASGAAAAKGKSKGKGKRNSGDCVKWTTDPCSRGDKCGRKHDPENKGDSKEKGRAVQLSRKEFSGKRDPDEKPANMLRLVKE